VSGIPERLWRVVRGHWELAQDRVDEAESISDAKAELAVAIRAAEAAQREADPAAPGQLPPPRAPAGGEHDPFEAAYELLQVRPGCDLAALDEAYGQRLAELDPARHAEGSPERRLAEGRRAAVEAAYEKLRDFLNPTETRFERIEF
jgi:hypothetical protein